MTKVFSLDIFRPVIGFPEQDQTALKQRIVAEGIVDLHFRDVSTLRIPVLRAGELNTVRRLNGHPRLEEETRDDLGDMIEKTLPDSSDYEYLTVPTWPLGIVESMDGGMVRADLVIATGWERVREEIAAAREVVNTRFAPTEDACGYRLGLDPEVTGASIAYGRSPQAIQELYDLLSNDPSLLPHTIHVDGVHILNVDS